MDLFLATSTASPAAIRSREDERSRAVPLCTITLARMLAHEVKALRLDRFPVVFDLLLGEQFLRVDMPRTSSGHRGLSPP